MRNGYMATLRVGVMLGRESLREQRTLGVVIQIPGVRQPVSFLELHQRGARAATAEPINRTRIEVEICQCNLRDPQSQIRETNPILGMGSGQARVIIIFLEVRAVLPP